MTVAGVTAAIVLLLQTEHIDLPKTRVDHIARVVAGEAKRNEVDPFLVLSVIWHESRFNASIVNEKSGAAGLMQLMPVHYKRKGRGLQWALRAGSNVAAGVKLIDLYRDRCGSIRAALWAYSGSNCKKSGKRNRSFAAKVFRTRGWLKREGNSGG